MKISELNVPRSSEEFRALPAEAKTLAIIAMDCGRSAEEVVAAVDDVKRLLSDGGRPGRAQ